MKNILFERKMSGFVLSISTGMAMETLFATRAPVYDESRIPPQRVSLERYNTVWINVRTLLRNIINACEYTTVREIRPKELARSLIEEIEIIQSLFANEGKSLITPIFYDSNYQTFYRGKDPQYKLRVVSTPKQVDWFNCLEQGLQEALMQGVQILHTGSTLRATRPGEKALILSHVTPDLLSYVNFSSMELLESHTGKIKTRREWNTKYSPLGSEQFENFPWTKQLLCYLGDKYIFSPLSITARRKILAVANERRWSPMTSPVVVDRDLQRHIDDESLKTLLKQISL